MRWALLVISLCATASAQAQGTHTEELTARELPSRAGTFRKVLSDSGRFDRLLLSLNADAWPSGSQVRVQVRLLVSRGPAVWTSWMSLGVYGEAKDLPRAERSSPSRGVRVATDLVESRTPALGAELRLDLRAGPGGLPRLRRVAVARWRRTTRPPRDTRRTKAWGRVLRVPQRSQKVEDPAIAMRVCSPTSLGMVLAYWGKTRPTAEVAKGVYDHGADIYGNWSFNVAYAAQLGMRATATHLDGWAQVEREILAGRPVVISHKYEAGQLTGSPVLATDGHLIVVVGFTREGDVVVNDPAADPRKGQSIRQVYRRAELTRTWQVNAEGIAYVLAPLKPR